MTSVEAIPTERAVSRLTVAALVCVLAFGFVAWFFVRTDAGQRLDNGALRGRVIQHPRTRQVSNRVLRTITEGSLALLGGALMTIALIRGRWHLALAVGAVILGANLTTEVFKELYPRPELVNVPGFNFNSLPSGHTTVAASLAAGLVMVVPARARPLAAFLGAAYAAMIAVAVLAAGWHRPSDAVAAFAVVGAWAFAASAVLVARRGSGRPAHQASMPGLALGAIAVLGLAFAALAVTTTLTRADGIQLVRLGAAYLVAAASLVVVAVAFAVALVVELRGISLDAHHPAP